MKEKDRYYTDEEADDRMHDDNGDDEVQKIIQGVNIRDRLGDLQELITLCFYGALHMREANLYADNAELVFAKFVSAEFGALDKKIMELSK